MVREERKTQVRDAFKRSTEDYFQTELAKLNLKQKSKGLARFYLFDIYSRIHAHVSDEDFEAGFVDNAGDLEVDFIHKDDDVVLIIQVKYAGEGVRTDPKDISHFQRVLTRLRSGSFTPNARLRDILRDVDFDHDTFVMKFVTLATIEGDAKASSELQPDIPDDLRDRADFEFIDVDKLRDELRRSLPDRGKKDVVCTLVAAGKRGARSPVIELEAGGHRSCVLVVQGEQLVNAYKQSSGDHLFSLNIRNYLGRSTTNKAIAKTLREEPANFYYYNNGISCLADSFEVDGDRVSATRLQVINGAQTVRSLTKTKSKSLEDVLVMVRITEVGGTGYGSEGQFPKKIVRWNNTQNVMKAADFRSNDPIQYDLKSRFENGLGRRKGKRVVYQSKRTDRFSESDEVVPLEEFAKVVYSFLFDPVSFSAKTSFLFDDDPDRGGYTRVFGDGKEVWVTMPEQDFRLRAALWWISRDFNARLKADRKAIDEHSKDAALEKAALERQWFLLFAAGQVLQRQLREKWRDEVAKLHKGDWTFGEGATGKWLAELYEISKELLLYGYRLDAKKPTFVHRNWMRSQDTVNSFEDMIRSVPMRDLPPRTAGAAAEK